MNEGSTGRRIKAESPSSDSVMSWILSHKEFQVLSIRQFWKCLGFSFFTFKSIKQLQRYIVNTSLHSFEYHN